MSKRDAPFDIRGEAEPMGRLHIIDATAELLRSVRCQLAVWADCCTALAQRERVNLCGDTFATILADQCDRLAQAEAMGRDLWRVDEDTHTAIACVRCALRVMADCCGQRLGTRLDLNSEALDTTLHDLARRLQLAESSVMASPAAPVPQVLPTGPAVPTTAEPAPFLGVPAEHPARRPQRRAERRPRTAPATPMGAQPCN